MSRDTGPAQKRPLINSADRKFDFQKCPKEKEGMEWNANRTGNGYFRNLLPILY